MPDVYLAIFLVPLKTSLFAVSKFPKWFIDPLSDFLNLEFYAVRNSHCSAVSNPSATACFLLYNKQVVVLQLNVTNEPLAEHALQSDTKAIK